jgi:hypothetical protein
MMAFDINNGWPIFARREPLELSRRQPEQRNGIAGDEKELLGRKQRR